MSEAIFYPYQQCWVRDESRFKVGMFARQTGKTFTTAFEIAQDCQLADLKGKKARWVILSRGERQAKEAMEEGVKLHCKALGSAIKAYETTYRGEANYKALEVEFPHGSRITALPANPDTARGFSANVFLDEFAFHKDSRKIWQALFPVISAGWKLRVVSTPNGKGNKFYDLMTSEDPIWHKHVVDIYQAVHEGLPRNIDELRRGVGDDDTWAQEYELKWLDEASAWLSFDLINSVEHDGAGIPAEYTGNPCFVGVDIGARNDLFVIFVLELVGDVLWCREIIAKKRISFAEQDALLAGVFDRYQVARCCIDQTGMGEKPVEDAKRRHGEYTVEGVLFSGASKLVMATTAKQKFEDRKLRLPVGNDPLRQDLHKLRKITTAAGNVRFDADRDAGGHADRTWGLFLAIHAADGGVADTTILSGPKRQSAAMFEGFN